MERTLVLIKPDALKRSLVGNVLTRFEQKGLKIVGIKMLQVSDALVREHYVHHVDKPFFASLARFIQSAPVVAICLEGMEAVKVVRQLAGATSGRVADIGTIRGDLSISGQSNLVHASDSPETAQAEVRRFFAESELFDYTKGDETTLYAEDERE